MKFGVGISYLLTTKRRCEVAFCKFYFVFFSVFINRLLAIDV